MVIGITNSWNQDEIKSQEDIPNKSNFTKKKKINHILIETNSVCETKTEPCRKWANNKNRNLPKHSKRDYQEKNGENENEIKFIWKYDFDFFKSLVIDIKKRLVLGDVIMAGHIFQCNAQRIILFAGIYVFV